MINNTTQISDIQDKAEDIGEMVDSGDLSEEQRASALETVQEAQTKVTDIRESVAEMKVPEPEIDTTSAEEMIDTTTTEDKLDLLEEQRQAELERLKDERDTAKAERADLKDELEETYDREPAETKLEEARQDLGVIEMLDEQKEHMATIKDLRDRATGLIEQRGAAMSAIGQQAISTPFITGQQNKISESYNRRINTISSHLGTEVAVYEAKQGNIEIARSMVAQIVDAYTYDTKLEVERVTAFINLNSDEISMLDEEYQTTLEESQTYWEDKLEEEKTEKVAVLELKLEYVKAGITIDDDLETASKKVAKWLGIQPDADVITLMSDYKTAGIEETDTYAEAINKIAQLPDENVLALMAANIGAGIKETDTYTEAVNKAARYKEEITNWELRTIGNEVWAIDRDDPTKKMLVTAAAESEMRDEYKELFDLAGGEEGLGMSFEEFIRIQAGFGEADWTEDEINSKIKEFMINPNNYIDDYADVVAAINSPDSIFPNREKALKVAKEYFKTEIDEESDKESDKGLAEKLEDRPTYTEYMSPEWGEPIPQGMMWHQRFIRKVYVGLPAEAGDIWEAW